MNILFLESSIPPSRGGVQRVSWLVSRYLNEHGHDTYFAFWFKDSDEVDEHHKIRIGKEGEVGKCSNRLYNFIKNKAINIIINQQCRNKFVSRVIKKVRDEQICKVVYCHHLSPDYGDYVNLGIKDCIKNLFSCMLFGVDMYSRWERKQYDISDRYVLLSESFKNEFIKRTKLRDTSKLRWISNPLSFPFTLASQYDNKKKQILIVSRMHERQKKLTSALRIWKEIEHRGYRDWNLVMAGYGPDEQMILDYAKSLNLSRMTYIGKVDNPAGLYMESSIFMMTSNYEGFGMTLTEALQFGCVPLAFDTYAALHDILTHGDNGFIIPIHDEGAYADQLCELIDNPTILKRMSRRAMESCKKFGMETVGQKWLDLINELQS